jgi:phenylacetate-coenzyme A ligase PaaK-like adenylate-forming protein
LYANVSQAVRVCVAAQEAGFDLAGAAIRLSSEPLTPAKAERMRRVGVQIVASYGSIETVAIGLGCARPTHVDEVHLATDAYALIDYPYCVPGIGITVPAFNLTGLLDSAPKVMLNYQSDDYGIVETRACGCGLEAYGYTTHLHEIRSYSKLVGEGVTLIGNEMLRILEEVLPARFGGTPLDYQMMEEEDGQGLTRLVLLVSPRVEIRDQAEVIEIILDALGKSSPMGANVRTVWQRAETLRIERREPVVTARGKLLPLHIERNSQKS